MRPYYQDATRGLTLHHGDCLDVLPTLATASVDAVVCDPPYPEIDRPYGRMTEPAWHEMMHAAVRTIRRVLKPTGSAVFILQPNSERLGHMRTWLWEFLTWVGKEWGVVQDAYWWNFTQSPTAHCQRTVGLMRPSVKTCVWCGPADCYRNQDAVLWEASLTNVAARSSSRMLEYQPSGGSMRRARCAQASAERGGTTPFNLLPISNAASRLKAGASRHGARTPLSLCAWWVRYLTPPGGLVLDPFAGTSTTGEAALAHGCRFIGIEKDAGHVDLSRARLEHESARAPCASAQEAC